MCIALQNTRAARPTARNNANGLNPATRTVPYIVGGVIPNRNNNRGAQMTDLSGIRNNGNVCKAVNYGVVPDLAAPWTPGALGRIVLTVSNVNEILDDSWDFRINGVTVCNYDGGGATTVSFSTDLPEGLVLELSAECVGEQSDNLFLVTVTVSGMTVISTEIGGEGTVGEVQELGDFTT